MDILIGILTNLKEIFWHPTVVILTLVLATVITGIIADKGLKTLQQEILTAVSKTKHKVRKMNKKRIELRDMSLVHVRKKNPNQ
jgi:HD superfamily phosphohydrolase